MRTFVASLMTLLGVLLLLPAAMAAGALWTVSACTRVLARRIESGHLTREQLVQYDPVFGWKSRPNLDTQHLTVDLFRIRTDADGWRGRVRLADSDIVVFGDSFAAGYGMGEEEFFANLRSDVGIKPVGIGGYNMVQELLWMRELAPRLRGKLVVWFVYCGNDLYDNLSPELRGYRRPFVREARRTGGWEIVTDHLRREPLPIMARSRRGDLHMATLAELCSDTFLAHRVYRACDFLLRQGKVICAAAGARLVVLSIPDRHQLFDEGRAYLQSLLPPGRPFDAGLPERRLADMCRVLDVPFVRGSDFLEADSYHTDDCHWNARGHRRVADRLADLHASTGSYSSLLAAGYPIARAVGGVQD